MFGGNFLHGLNIEMEVRVAELETAMGIEPKVSISWISRHAVVRSGISLQGTSACCLAAVGCGGSSAKYPTITQKSPKFEGLNRREVEQLAWLADYLQGEVEKHADLRDPPHSETEDDIPSAWLTCRAAGYSTPAALLAQLKRRCKGEWQRWWCLFPLAFEGTLYRPVQFFVLPRLASRGHPRRHESL